jgi:hypothetical protein
MLAGDHHVRDERLFDAVGGLVEAVAVGAGAGGFGPFGIPQGP